MASNGVGASSSACTSGNRYASGYNYNTAGEVTGFNYGNGVVTNISYSPDRLQLHCLQYDTTSVIDPCTKDSSALFMLTYGYGSSGANNGQISGITDSMDGGRTAAYTYDALSRLSTAGTTGSSGYAGWGLSWNYDLYGNRTAQNNTGGSVPSDSLTISTSTNHVTGSGYSYDAAGNMTGDYVNTLTYDAASHLISSSNGTSGGAYAYDGKGMRVQKCVPSCSSPTTTTVYIFAGGKVLAEYDNGAAYTSPSREYVYSGGTQIAKIAGSTATYYHQDHLSNRLVTSSSGSIAEQMGHLSFGEYWYDTGSEKWIFTTYERDAESGNDYAKARYHVNRLGRFSSPDPHSGSAADPQSLNHYIYANNDPVNVADPSGRDGDMLEATGYCTVLANSNSDGSADQNEQQYVDGLNDSKSCGGAGGTWTSDGSTATPVSVYNYVSNFDNGTLNLGSNAPGFGLVSPMTSTGMSITFQNQMTALGAWVNQIQTDQMTANPGDILSMGTTPTAFPSDAMQTLGSNTTTTTSFLNALGLAGLVPQTSDNPASSQSKTPTYIYTCSLQGTAGNYLCTTRGSPPGGQPFIFTSSQNTNFSSVCEAGTVPSIITVSVQGAGQPTVTSCQ